MADVRITPNFYLGEFASKDGAPFPSKVVDNLVRRLIPALQTIRNHLGSPLHVTSAYRSPEHNARVGGAQNSYHLQGLAADLVSRRTQVGELHALVLHLIDEGHIPDGGLGLYPSWIHYDLGTKRRWQIT